MLLEGTSWDIPNIPLGVSLKKKLPLFVQIYLFLVFRNVFLMPLDYFFSVALYSLVFSNRCCFPLISIPPNKMFLKD
jgi:hypothetical protein